MTLFELGTRSLTEQCGSRAISTILSLIGVYLPGWLQPQGPQRQSHQHDRRDTNILAEAVGQIAVALRIKHRKRLPQLGAGQLKISKIPLRHADKAMRHGTYSRDNGRQYHLPT